MIVLYTLSGPIQKRLRHVTIIILNEIVCGANVTALVLYTIISLNEIVRLELKLRCLIFYNSKLNTNGLKYSRCRCYAFSNENEVLEEDKYSMKTENKFNEMKFFKPSETKYA